jgi:transposase
VIIIGIDPHKRTHTAVAVQRQSGELIAELTVPATAEGSSKLVAWALALAPASVFALEDCRHVSGPLKRFLLARSLPVVRVPPKLMAATRRSQRQRGKSDAIDAAAVARAYLREPGLPPARLDPQARELKLLTDYRDELVAERTRLCNRVRWQLHELGSGADLPSGSLDRQRWQKQIQDRLARLPQTTQIRIVTEQLERIVELTRRANKLEREITLRLRKTAPALLTLPGCAALTAAKVVAETGGIERFSDDAALALHAGVAPLDASSGQQRRHRLNRSGNRQLNCALHRIAVTQGRFHPPAQTYLARRQAEGKTRREALRCLKRHLARTVYKTLADAAANTPTPPQPEPALT